MICPPDPLSMAEEDEAAPRRGTLVTVGRSTRYRFTRLIDAVHDVLPMLPQPVLIQHPGQPPAGRSGATVVDFLSHEAFRAQMSRAELLICHAGAGTIVEALRAGVPAVVMARQPDLGESADGHQIEFLDMLSQLGLVHAATDARSLRSILGGLRKSVSPLQDPLNQRMLVEHVRSDIASMLRRGARPRIALVATSGGHMTELLELRDAYEGVPHFYVTSDRLPAVRSCDSGHVFRSGDRDWRVVRNIPAISRMLVKERPGIVLSTGSSSAIPVILMARLLGARVIYVESLTRVRRPSLTARVVYPASDSFIVRWPEAGRPFRRAHIVHAGIEAFGTMGMSTSVREAAIRPASLRRRSGT